MRQHTLVYADHGIHYCDHRGAAVNTRELCQQLEATIHQEIPISRFMGVHVLHYEPGTLTIAADFTPNINGHKTAFAGSLYSLCALSGWGLATLETQIHSAAAEIVVAKGNIKYAQPVQDEPIIARAKLNGDSNDIFSQFATNRKARMEIESIIMAGSTPPDTMVGNAKAAVLFTGHYALLAPH